MEKQLLIVGAGIYSAIAREIAEQLGCYTKVSFVDDFRKVTVNGDKVIGKVCDVEKLSNAYTDIIVAIGDPEARMRILKSIQKSGVIRIATLISPNAFVSRFAQVEEGCIVEPMAVVQAKCRIRLGCIISAGAVVNHSAACCEGVHIDCNATVEGYAVVPPHTKVHSGQVYREVNYGWTRNYRSNDSTEYSFDAGM